ncbi:group II intron-encoding maturase variant [Symbiobacterium thermophilum IAM 14863]|uniref:Group II intron-encoding maturase variant n=1 Tax=Symbiobacterium thermophilum (strain DSM 24528 / JCM 14929 / IAM 14863 / T) TaxID=292459 RepID=Q67M72_SYMTH|nr:group II intron-encoding maturase variant [Symbiobacterium thermophilum IAM 14863]
MEQVVARENMLAALKRVERNGGAQAFGRGGGVMMRSGRHVSTWRKGTTGSWTWTWRSSSTGSTTTC